MGSPESYCRYTEWTRIWGPEGKPKVTCFEVIKIIGLPFSHPGDRVFSKLERSAYLVVWHEYLAVSSLTLGSHGKC